MTGTGSAQGLPALQDKGQMLGVNFSFPPRVLISSAVPNVILGPHQEFNFKAVNLFFRLYSAHGTSLSTGSRKAPKITH